MNYLILGVLWVLSGLAVAFLMGKTDELKSNNYWIKDKNKLLYVFLLVVCAPGSLIIGVVVFGEYLKQHK